MILYHGSLVVVERPLVGIGRSDLDFGPGFYLTKHREQAERWAKIRSGRKKNSEAFLNIYEFDRNSLNNAVYKLLSFEDYNKEWLDFVAFSRKGMRPWLGYDAIEGGIANDSVITTVDLYVDGIITVEQALDKLVNTELRHQICIANQVLVDSCLTFKQSIRL